METDQTAHPRASSFWTATALREAGDPQCHILRGAQRLCMEADAARSPSLAYRLLLFHGVAAERSLAKGSRYPAGEGPAQERKKKAPTAAILDSQSVKVSNHGGMRGYDAGKKIMGRKRHILVDTLGLILHVVVHSAAVQDRDGARLVLQVLLSRFGWLRCIFVDGGYAGELVKWVQCLLPGRGLRLEVVKRSDAHKHRFAVLPKRWIVERTFAWLSKFRRLSKDYEYRTENSEAMILIAATRLMLARLA